MIRRLSHIGEEFGLVIDRAVLQQLHIDQDTGVDGEAIIIRPKQGTRARQIDRLVDAAADEHTSAFERLAK